MSILSLLVPVALACGGCAQPADATPATPAAVTASGQPAAASTTATLHVEGMTCASCATAIKVALGRVEGVQSIDVDVAGKKATVTYDPASVTPDALAKTVSALGYPATVQG